MKEKRVPSPDLEELIPILIGAWRRFKKLPGPADHLQTREFRSVVEGIQTLRRQEGDLSHPDLLGAYLLYQWVIHYQQALTILNEVPSTPTRVLDICSGPAPLALAALRHGAHDVIAVDKNKKALELGADVCGRYGYPLSIRSWDCLKEKKPFEGSFDLILLGHCLEELFPPTQKNWKEAQHEFLTSLLGYLKPEGFLVIIDDSRLETNTRVLEIRDRFVKAGIPVQAPCVWRGECPALKTSNSPCYAQREMEKPYLIKEIQRAAQINANSLKMSYLIFRNPQAGWPSLPPLPLYRVISPPVETFHGKRFYLCGTEGKKNLGSHFEVPPKEARAFEYLRRGELISIQNPLEKQQILDIVEGTIVKIEAACGKPLPEDNPSHEFGSE